MLIALQEIYLTFLKVRCSSKILSSPAPLSSLTCEYLCSVLLREPVTGHNIISYLLGSEPSSTEHNRRLEDLELQCLQVLLTKLRKLSEQSSSTDDEEIDAKILKCRFCDQHCSLKCSSKLRSSSRNYSTLKVKELISRRL